MTAGKKTTLEDLFERNRDRFTWSNRTLLGSPTIDERPAQPYLGIRIQTQFTGMFRVTDKLAKDLRTWIQAHDIAPTGPSFLRYHIIDMEGEMDVEVGVPVAEPLAGDGHVRPGVLPAGRYASLIYIGNGYTGNGALLRWCIENGLERDTWNDPKGNAFRSRYEAFLTDPVIEPRKTKWEVEVAIKLVD